MQCVCAGLWVHVLEKKDYEVNLPKSYFYSHRMYQLLLAKSLKIISFSSFSYLVSRESSPSDQKQHPLRIAYSSWH